MANQAVRVWEALLHSLTDMRCGKSCNIKEVVKKVEDLRAQPKATWKRLVQDMQVRRGPAWRQQSKPRPRSLNRQKACLTAPCLAPAVPGGAAAA